MDLDSALARLRAIVGGIDEDETEDDSGWWENSTGAAFGAARLVELEAFVRELVSS